MSGKGINIVESVRQRLRKKAVETGEIPDFVAARFAYERLLFRLSKSEEANKFVLKGALLFYVWNHKLHRPTRDMDLLGFGPSDTDSVLAAIQRIIAIPAPEDGLNFLPESVIAEPIRAQATYGGIRVKLMAKLGDSRIPLQLDIGYGDAITPGPELGEFPAVLANFPAPVIRAYPVYTVVAEKLEAMVMLGDQNSRMKDFFDVLFILRTENLDPVRLAQAITATFSHRKTSLPSNAPPALTNDFAKKKEEMWKAFLRRNGIASEAEPFTQVIAEINARLPYRWDGK